MRSLPDTATHDQQWESNPRPSDPESNTLSTGPHAPICFIAVVRSSQVVVFGVMQLDSFLLIRFTSL